MPAFFAHGRGQRTGVDDGMGELGEGRGAAGMIGMAMGEEDMADRRGRYAVAGEHGLDRRHVASGAGVEEHPLAACIDGEDVAVESVGQVEAAAAAHHQVHSVIEAHRHSTPSRAGRSPAPPRPSRQDHAYRNLF